MNGQKKVYVIDPASSKARTDITALKEMEGKGPEGNPGPPQNTGRRNGNASAVKTDNRESGVPLLLSYLAGPLSILATRRGRRIRFWVILAFFSVVVSTALSIMWQRARFWLPYEDPAGAVLLTASIVALISGCLVWTRAVILNGRHEGPRLRRSPAWMRGPLAAGIFGTICPGMGLYVAGRSRQAAVSLWMTCITVISVILVSKSGWLWDFNRHAGVFAVRPDTLEYMLAGTALVAALGMLAWAVQALNGIRLAMPSRERKTATGKNTVAVALLVSLAAFPVFFRPAVIAEALDAGAIATRSRGMRIIPVYLSLASARLDPSSPGYTVRTIELYENMGDQAAADRLRGELLGRLEASMPLLEEEGIIMSEQRREYGHATDPAAIDVLDYYGEDRNGPAIPTIPAELMSLDWTTSREVP